MKIIFPNMTRYDFATLIAAMNIRRAVEVGVFRAEYTHWLLANTDLDLLWGVDPYTNRFTNGLQNTAHATLAQFGERFALQQTSSLKAAHEAKSTGQTFGFVFIDGSHHQRDVKADIEAWLPVLEPPGIIAGHDYIPGMETYAIDVIPAVDYWQQRLNQPLYLTGEKWASWFFILGDKQEV